ncbi:hypothetical protein ACQPZ2_00660 [Nocardia pseudovaccinii]|uniref:hypothetical protein n=1 Tax=Nocardia pseudovaccinii TaxID=189540 RepID=UPI003D8D1D81
MGQSSSRYVVAQYDWRSWIEDCNILHPCSLPSSSNRVIDSERTDGKDIDMVDINEFQRATYAWQWAWILATSRTGNPHEVPADWIARYLSGERALDPNRPLAFLTALAALNVKEEPEQCRTLHAAAVEAAFEDAELAGVLAEPVGLPPVDQKEARAKAIAHAHEEVFEDLRSDVGTFPAGALVSFWFPS